MDTAQITHPLAGLTRDAEAATTIIERTDETGDALAFRPEPAHSATRERKLAEKLIGAYAAWTGATEAWHARTGTQKAQEIAANRFLAMAEVASDVLGYGMTGTAVHFLFNDAWSAFEDAFGPMPPATDARRVAYRETRTDFVVDMLREIR